MGRGRPACCGSPGQAPKWPLRWVGVVVSFRKKLVNCLSPHVFERYIGFPHHFYRGYFSFLTSDISILTVRCGLSFLCLARLRQEDYCEASEERGETFWEGFGGMG